MRGLIRSAINTSSGDTQGGSTLTMQYVKQIRYYQAGDNPKKQAEAIAQNLNRKIEDAKCALYIEGTKHESKQQILDNYLNIAFFGENSYGIQTAARTYFDKDAKQLTLPESAMLVGLLRAPTEYDPFINPEAARTRRDQVIDNLVTVGDLTQGQAAKYKATPVSLATTAPPQVREGCANAPDNVTNVGFFCDYAVNWLLDHKAVTESQLQTGGLKIVTTLDAKMQNSMQRKLFAKLSTKAPMAAIMPVVDPHTGEVLAMATSKKYGASGQGRNDLAADLHLLHRAGRVDLQAVPAAGRALDRGQPGLAAEDTGRAVPVAVVPAGQRRRLQRRRERELQPRRQPDHAPGDRQVVQHLLRGRRRPAVRLPAAADHPDGREARHQQLLPARRRAAHRHRAVDPELPERDPAHPGRHRDEPARADRGLRGGRQRRPLQRAGADQVGDREQRRPDPGAAHRRASGRQPRGGPRGRGHPQGRHPLRRHLRGRVRELVRPAPGHRDRRQDRHRPRHRAARQEGRQERRAVVRRHHPRLCGHDRADRPEQPELRRRRACRGSPTRPTTPTAARRPSSGSPRWGRR